VVEFTLFKTFIEVHHRKIVCLLTSVSPGRWLWIHCCREEEVGHTKHFTDVSCPFRGRGSRLDGKIQKPGLSLRSLTWTEHSLQIQGISEPQFFPQHLI